MIIIASDGKYSDKLILHIVILDIDESIGITVTEDKEGDLTFWSDQNLILDAKTLRELLNGDKDITIAIKDQDGREIYKWIFEKDNLLSSAHNITDIDLTLSVSQIPDNDEIWGRLGEDEGAKGLVLSFGHDGILPAQATIKIYVGDQEGIIPGDKIYLYHYNHESGKLETLPYSSKLIVDQEGYLTITILHCSDYIALHKEADNKKITSLRNQISITPHKRTIYLEYNTTPVRIQVNLPVTLELVESLDDKTSQPMIGGVTVTYSSGNHQVASIDNKGKITIIGAGKAEITARITLYSGKTKEFTTVITVKEPHIKITLHKNKMKVGEVFTFKAQAYGLDSEDITWTTSAKSIIVINKKTGRAVAKSKGTDYVIAAIGDKRDKVKVTVK